MLYFVEKVYAGRAHILKKEEVCIIRRSLLDVIFMSEKRKNLLLLLRQGPHNMNEIIEVLDVTRHAILPQIKILSESGLIVKKRDVCSLTELGDIVVEDMLPLVDTLKVIEDNYDYWMEHEIDSIPPHLLRRIRELNNCKIAEPDLNDMFELNRDLIEKSLDSSFIMGATAFLHPAFPSFLIDLVNNNIEVTIIMSKGALEKHKQDYEKELRDFFFSKTGKLFVYPEDMKLASLFISEKFLMICLFDKDGKYDSKDLVFCNEAAMHWGKELFEYYLSQSYSVEEI